MKKIGIYIHIPFCKSKCPYCDFYSVKVNNEEMDRYVQELNNKFEFYSKDLSDNGYIVDTVYFGGGTPSTMGTTRLVKLLKAIKSSFCLADDVEITMEMNPTSSNLVDFTILKEMGLNRLSVGMQSAVDDEMKLLGRNHTQRDIEYTVRTAQKCGIRNISLDLIIGVPEQTKSTLKQSMDFCNSLGVQHISAYILKIEENTPFYKMKENLNLLTDDEQAEQYLYVCEYLESLGYCQYEISNFAINGYESRHNNKYWRCEEYLGFGPSAHSFFKGKRFYYDRDFSDFYDNKLTDDGFGGSKEEFIMLNLRLKRGLIFKEFKERYSHDIPEKFIKKAKLLSNAGYITINKEKVSLTKKGYLLSNTIITELLSCI